MSESRRLVVETTGEKEERWKIVEQLVAGAGGPWDQKVKAGDSVT